MNRLSLPANFCRIIHIFTNISNKIFGRIDGAVIRLWRLNYCLACIALLFTLLSRKRTGFDETAPAVAAVQRLVVNGSHIHLVGDDTDKKAAISGNSLFWSNQGWGGERFYNAKVVKWLHRDWNANIVRAAMGVEAPGGYLEHQENESRVRTVVDAAIAEGIYVIIDWHSHEAENHRHAAIRFFTKMAKIYGQYPNVIYEIYNEPLQISWSDTIKPYAEAVIDAIRGEDPDNLIVVGTPSWSQGVDQAAADPITAGDGFKNIAYSLHFYAGTHTAWLRDRAEHAMAAGIALVVTEWGTCDASGNGSVDVAETKAWVDWMKKNNLIHLNWSLNDKDESASALRPGVSSGGNWSQSELSQSGELVRSIIRHKE